MKRHVRFVLAAILTGWLALAVLAQPGGPSTWHGIVVKIADGDTITILTDKTTYSVRLEHIDAPEAKQDFGAKAKIALSDKIFGKAVKVTWKAKDRYKRILGEVHLGERNINLEMVAEGYAWHYVAYSKNAAYAAAEKDAKDRHRGLWSKPVPPWDFRRGKGEEDPNAGKTDPATFTVFATKGETKYHAFGCKFLAKSKIPLTLAEASAKYEPCAVCKPPVFKK